jgi:hypothetical protein
LAQSPIPNPQSPIPNPQSPLMQIIIISVILNILKDELLLINKKLLKENG